MVPLWHLFLQFFVNSYFSTPALLSLSSVPSQIPPLVPTTDPISFHLPSAVKHRYCSLLRSLSATDVTTRLPFASQLTRISSYILLKMLPCNKVKWTRESFFLTGRSKQLPLVSFAHAENMFRFVHIFCESARVRVF